MVEYPQPPAGYFRIYPRTDTQGQRSSSQQPSRPGSAASGSNATPRPQAYSLSAFVKPGPSLIEKYQLKERVSQQEDVAIDTPEQAGGKAAWEATPERREASLKERKAQMILAARKYVLPDSCHLCSYPQFSSCRRLLEQQKAAETAEQVPSSSGLKTE